VQGGDGVSPFPSLDVSSTCLRFQAISCLCLHRFMFCGVTETTWNHDCLGDIYVRVIVSAPLAV
jgi:hypothetical protein